MEEETHISLHHLVIGPCHDAESNVGIPTQNECIKTTDPEEVSASAWMDVSRIQLSADSRPQSEEEHFDWLFLHDFARKAFSSVFTVLDSATPSVLNVLELKYRAS